MKTTREEMQDRIIVIDDEVKHRLMKPMFLRDLLMQYNEMYDADDFYIKMVKRFNKYEI